MYGLDRFTHEIWISFGLFTIFLDFGDTLPLFNDILTGGCDFHVYIAFTLLRSILLGGHMLFSIRR